MDYFIEKKNKLPKRILILAGVVICIGLLFFVIWKTTGRSKLSVQAEGITIAEVTRGPFREFIPATGIVFPLTTNYLDLQEGGRIEEIYVEDGAMLKQGDPILRLENIDLKLNLLNQETSVYNMLMQMQIAQNSSRQNTINNQTQVVDMENLLKEAKRIYDLNRELFEKGVISSQEFQESANRYEYTQKKTELVKRMSIQDSVASPQQIAQQQQSYLGAKSALDLMRRKVVDLTVRAPVDGQLTSFDSEIGQNMNRSERIGQVDVLSGFKIKVDVDEHYIMRVYTGLEGVYKSEDTTYSLVIKKIHTEVMEGRFTVDMVFKEKVPENIRRGQSLQIRIALSDETQAVLIPRGGFYQATGGNWIFKLTKEGRTAYKTPIRIGRQNPDYYEVLEGVQVGDRLIVNSYDNYGDAQELRIK